MEKVTNAVNRLTNFMEQDIKAVHVSIFDNVVNDNIFDNEQFCLFLQIGCYSIALIGLTVAIRKVRPVSTFLMPT